MIKTLSSIKTLNLIIKKNSKYKIEHIIYTVECGGVRVQIEGYIVDTLSTYNGRKVITICVISASVKKRMIFKQYRKNDKFQIHAYTDKDGVLQPIKKHGKTQPVICAAPPTDIADSVYIGAFRAICTNQSTDLNTLFHKVTRKVYTPLIKLAINHDTLITVSNQFYVWSKTHINCRSNRKLMIDDLSEPTPEKSSEPTPVNNSGICQLFGFA